MMTGRPIPGYDWLLPRMRSRTHIHSPRRAAAVAACLAACAAALFAPQAASAATPKGLPKFRGAQIGTLAPGVSDAYVDNQLDLARRLGGNVVKVDVSWNAVEPNAKGELDPAYLANVDHLVNAAAARGLKILLLFQGSPCWASSAPSSIGCGDYRNSTYPPKNPKDYADTAATLAARYGGKLSAWEVWNEPDHENEYYWAGPHKAQKYAALLKATYRPLKRANKKLIVLGGSLVGAQGKFLKALYKQGIKGSYDAISIHFYDLVLASVRSIRSVQRAAGDKKPLWLTEFGWNSCYPKASNQGGHLCVTPKRQASDLADIFRALKGHKEVQGATIYSLLDSDLSFGLATRRFSPKPSFNSMRKLFTKKLGSPNAPTIKASGGKARGTVPAGDGVQLLAIAPGGGVRFSTVVNYDRNNRYSWRLPGGVRKGWRIRAIQPWTGRSSTARVK